MSENKCPVGAEFINYNTPPETLIYEKPLPASLYSTHPLECTKHTLAANQLLWPQTLSQTHHSFTLIASAYENIGIDLTIFSFTSDINRP